MVKNPLIPDILALLHEHTAGISEYLIIKSLDSHIGFDGIGDDYQLALFQKHFMVMNALYQLQQQLAEEHLLLEISPLNIQLTTLPAGTSETQLTDSVNAKLGEYYLDWSNFNNTSSEDVEALLEKFWTLYISADDRLEALTVLELDAEACEASINRRYRELAAIHHPDKGGDPAVFIRIRQAYETLTPGK